jgi:Leucine Rich repeat
MTQDISIERQGSNELCFMCAVQVPSMCCICNNKVILLCQECVGLHTKTGLSHSIEPIEAAAFIKETQDISAYFNRKTRIQKFLVYLDQHNDNINNLKKKFKNAIEKIQNSLNEAYVQGNEKFDELQGSLYELRNKISLAQFSVNLDMSDFVHSLIDQPDYAKFNASLQQLDLYSISTTYQVFETLIPNIISIKNSIPYCNNQMLQLQSYYNENKSSMTEYMQRLFNIVIDSQAASIDRFSNIESSEDVVKHLSMILGYFKNLKVLDMSEHHIKTSGAKLISNCIKNCQQITELSLGGNEILDEGCSYISEALPYLPNLENLFLYKNCLTSSAALKLAETLPCIPNLKLISLNQNTIGDDGLEYICGILKALPNLEALGLQKNQITSRSSKNIVKLITELCNLSDLSLDDNSVGDQTAKELIKVFPGIKKPLKIYLRQNDINEQLENELRSSGNGKVFVMISYRI